jgi:tRNA G37 N-methylase TrmD
MRMPVGPDGKVRHIKTLDDELIEAAPTSLAKGVLVVIARGRHQGIDGRVKKVTDDRMCVIKISRSGEVRANMYMCS